MKWIYYIVATLLITWLLIVSPRAVYAFSYLNIPDINFSVFDEVLRVLYQPPPEKLVQASFEPPPTNKELIIQYSIEYGAKTDLALAIAYAESQYNNVCNKKYGCYAGQGIFQFIPSSWDALCRGDVMNVEDNIKCGVRLISEGKVEHWGNSTSLWGTWRYWQDKL